VASAVARGAENAWDTVSDWGRGYPVATLLVGAGLGFAAAKLLTSQSSAACRTAGSSSYGAQSGSAHTGASRPPEAWSGRR
jgi:hypothetical protein